MSYVLGMLATASAKVIAVDITINHSHRYGKTIATATAKGKFVAKSIAEDKTIAKV